MSDDLIERILSQLEAERDHVERVVPYLNNEPFADRRMLDVLRNLRDRVGAHVELSTNASLLGEARARALVEEDLVQDAADQLLRGEPRDLRGPAWSGCRGGSRPRTSRACWRCAPAHASQIAVELIMVGTERLRADEVRAARDRFEPLGAQVKIFGYLDRAASNVERNLLPRIQSWAPLRGCELNRPFERMAIRADGASVLCSQDWRAEVGPGGCPRVHPAGDLARRAVPHDPR